jgi:hypothetical protein
VDDLELYGEKVEDSDNDRSTESNDERLRPLWIWYSGPHLITLQLLKIGGDRFSH